MSDNAEIHEIKKNLERLDKRLAEIHLLLKGSTNLNLEGILPSLNRISKQFEDIYDWKNAVELKKGTINVKDVMTILAYVVGVAGGVFGIFTAYYNIFEK